LRVREGEGGIGANLRVYPLINYFITLITSITVQNNCLKKYYKMSAEKDKVANDWQNLSSSIWMNIRPYPRDGNTIMLASKGVEKIYSTK